MSVVTYLWERDVLEYLTLWSSPCLITTPSVVIRHVPQLERDFTSKASFWAFLSAAFDSYGDFTQVLVVLGFSEELFVAKLEVFEVM